MKKILLLLTFVGLIAILGFAGYYFSRTREIFEGHVSIHKTDSYGHSTHVDVSGLSVRLYDSRDVDKWLADPLVASLLNWKNLDKELVLLDDLLSEYQSLATIYPKNSKLAQEHDARIAQIAEYSSLLQSPVKAANQTFPEDLFKGLRTSIPDSISEAVLTLYTSKKDTLDEPIKDSFFAYIEGNFPSMTPYLFETIKNKFLSNAPAKYQPRLSSTEAENIINQFVQIDEIALELLQYNKNDKEILDKAPKPLQIQQTNIGGQVRFEIERFSKKYALTTKFVVIAVSTDTSLHPGKSFAWMKPISIDPSQLLIEEKLPFFAPTQRFILNNHNATSELSTITVDKAAPNPKAPFSPLKFKLGPTHETKFSAISLLSKRELAEESSHSSAHSHSHSHANDHGSKASHSSIYELQDSKANPRSKQHSQTIKSIEQLVADSNAVSTSEASNRPNFDILADVPPNKTSEPSEVVPDLEDILKAKSEQTSSIKVSSIHPKQLYGTWVNIQEQHTYTFNEDNTFIFSIDDDKILSGYFDVSNLDTVSVVNLIHISDGAVNPTLIHLESPNELKLELGFKAEKPKTQFTSAALLFRRIK